MKSKAYLSSTYLGPIHYYSKLLAYPHLTIEQHDHYSKQTYRNRCLIATAEGIQALTIPTERHSGSKCLMKDVRISSHGNWQHTHWNAIVSAYRHSPFFEYYEDDFHPFYEKKFNFLFDYNMGLQALVCELIDIEPQLEISSDYLSTNENEVDDYRTMIHPKKNFREDASFKSLPYYQVFQQRHGFQSNLSILDLLFNMGPESLLVLQQSIVSHTVSEMR